eukprot:maker-scaffold168_size293125-snap-gene-0.28 protein:Tk04457 transcript:maker-scaffold168_size293125-snap-gene-0.28-mRNA-1 annotation:"cation transport regulator-like protein 2"
MVWIFGYGSLIWKVGFPYKRKVKGYVKGYERRGTPDKPGRVVNLLSTDDASEKVWGVAYEIDEELWESSIKQKLDHREKGGYSQRRELFYPQNDTEDPKEVTLYIGEKTHRQYAGPDDLGVMAQTILTRVGPSGPNKDYLYNLAQAMRDIDPLDQHIFELERAVKTLERSVAEKE